MLTKQQRLDPELTSKIVNTVTHILVTPLTGLGILKNSKVSTLPIKKFTYRNSDRYWGLSIRHTGDNKINNLLNKFPGIRKLKREETIAEITLGYNQHGTPAIMITCFIEYFRTIEEWIPYIIKEVKKEHGITIGRIALSSPFPFKISS